MLFINYMLILLSYNSIHSIKLELYHALPSHTESFRHGPGGESGRLPTWLPSSVCRSTYYCLSAFTLSLLENPTIYYSFYHFLTLFFATFVPVFLHSCLLLSKPALVFMILLCRSSWLYVVLQVQYCCPCKLYSPQGPECSFQLFCSCWLYIVYLFSKDW